MLLDSWFRNATAIVRKGHIGPKSCERISGKWHPEIHVDQWVSSGVVFDSDHHSSNCYPHWGSWAHTKQKGNFSWITRWWLNNISLICSLLFLKRWVPFLPQSQRVHARIIAPVHTYLLRTNDFAQECNFCAALWRFNQRYYPNLPFLGSLLPVLWWMCCYPMMYVYRLPRITAVLKNYSFPLLSRKPPLCKNHSGISGLSLSFT